MDPPAEMEQNSNNPSKAGQSSPIKTGVESSVSRGSNAEGVRRRTAGSVPAHVLHRFGTDASEEIDVFVRVEFRHFVRGGAGGPEDVHFAVEAVVEDEVVRHFDSVRFHGMNWTATRQNEQRFARRAAATYRGCRRTSQHPLRAGTKK